MGLRVGANWDVDIALMDIMMPDMYGRDTGGEQ
jgi:CheY-like chemotaxis protein